MASDPSIGRSQANLRCIACGRTFYSTAARQMLARGERCPECGERLSADVSRQSELQPEAEDDDPAPLLA